MQINGLVRSSCEPCTDVRCMPKWDRSGVKLVVLAGIFFTPRKRRILFYQSSLVVRCKFRDDRDRFEKQSLLNFFAYYIIAWQNTRKIKRFSSVSDCHETHIRRKDSTIARRFRAGQSWKTHFRAVVLSGNFTKSKTKRDRKGLKTVPKRTKRRRRTLRRDSLRRHESFERFGTLFGRKLRSVQGSLKLSSI